MTWKDFQENNSSALCFAWHRSVSRCNKCNIPRNQFTNICIHIICYLDSTISYKLSRSPATIPEISWIISLEGTYNMFNDPYCVSMQKQRNKCKNHAKNIRNAEQCFITFMVEIASQRQALIVAKWPAVEFRSRVVIEIIIHISLEMTWKRGSLLVSAFVYFSFLFFEAVCCLRSRKALSKKAQRHRRVVAVSMSMYVNRHDTAPTNKTFINIFVISHIIACLLVMVSHHTNESTWFCCSRILSVMMS